MKKVLLSFVSILSLFLCVNVKAASCKKEINVHIFWGNGCPHCEEAIKFFASIEEEYGKCFNLVKHEVWYDKDNSKLMQEVADHFGEEVTGVPYIVIGEKTYKGFASSESDTIKKDIEDASNDKEFEDVVTKIIDGDYEKSGGAVDTIITLSIIIIAIGGIAALYFVSKK